MVAPIRIDANRAPWHEWALLDGIGEARAKKIVVLRAERGGFRSIEDLEALPGMPRGWTEKIREFLTFDERPLP